MCVCVVSQYKSEKQPCGKGQPTSTLPDVSFATDDIKFEQLSAFWGFIQTSPLPHPSFHSVRNHISRHTRNLASQLPGKHLNNGMFLWSDE